MARVPARGERGVRHRPHRHAAGAAGHRLRHRGRPGRRRAARLPGGQGRPPRAQAGQGASRVHARQGVGRRAQRRADGSLRLQLHALLHALLRRGDAVAARPRGRCSACGIRFARAWAVAAAPPRPRRVRTDAGRRGCAATGGADGSRRGGRALAPRGRAIATPGSAWRSSVACSASSPSSRAGSWACSTAAAIPWPRCASAWASGPARARPRGPPAPVKPPASPPTPTAPVQPSATAQAPSTRRPRRRHRRQRQRPTGFDADAIREPVARARRRAVGAERTGAGDAAADTIAAVEAGPGQAPDAERRHLADGVAPGRLGGVTDEPRGAVHAALRDRVRSVRDDGGRRARRASAHPGRLSDRAVPPADRRRALRGAARADPQQPRGPDARRRRCASRDSPRPA